MLSKLLKAIYIRPRNYIAIPLSIFPLLELPSEIILRLLEFVDMRTILALSLTNRACYRLTYCDTLWRALSIRHFSKLLYDQSLDRLYRHLKSHYEVYKRIYGAKVLTWGASNRGRLGRPITENVTISGQYLPGIVVDTPSNIVQIACMAWGMCCLTGTGQIYGWGTINLEGYGSQYQRNSASLIGSNPTNEYGVIMKIACGDDFGVALTEQGKVYYWVSWDKLVPVPISQQGKQSVVPCTDINTSSSMIVMLYGESNKMVLFNPHTLKLQTVTLPYVTLRSICAVRKDVFAISYNDTMDDSHSKSHTLWQWEHAQREWYKLSENIDSKQLVRAAGHSVICYDSPCINNCENSKNTKQPIISLWHLDKSQCARRITDSSIHLPLPLPIMTDTRIAQMAMGDCHAGMLFSDGTLWTAGKFSEGAIGHPPWPLTEPYLQNSQRHIRLFQETPMPFTQMNILKGYFVLSVAMNSWHSTALCVDLRS